LPQPHTHEHVTPPREHHEIDVRDRRPALGPAIVSGGCAVAVALISGLFNLINRPPAAPSAPTPTLTIERPAREPQPQRTASLDAPAAATPSPRRPEPIYALNFAAFQNVVRDTQASDEVRRKVVDRVVGNAVMWQGYVAKVVPNDPSERGLIGTIVLVEDPILVTQTLQPYAAYCRFTEDPYGELSQLQPGQSVTIRGDCASHTALGAEIQNCHLVEAPQPIAERAETVTR
jgi:hypothetical protein